MDELYTSKAFGIRCRVFLSRYMKERNDLFLQDLKLWTDKDIINFVRINFFFFCDMENPNIIIVIPRCHRDNYLLKNVVFKI